MFLEVEFFFNTNIRINIDTHTTVVNLNVTNIYEYLNNVYQTQMNQHPKFLIIRIAVTV